MTVFFCLWLPVGALLLFVRIFVMISFLVIMYSLPNWISDVVTPVLFVNCILPFCGIFVYGNGKQHLKNLKEPYVLAGNHVRSNVLSLVQNQDTKLTFQRFGRISLHRCQTTTHSS